MWHATIFISTVSTIKRLALLLLLTNVCYETGYRRIIHISAKTPNHFMLGALGIVGTVVQMVQSSADQLVPKAVNNLLLLI